MNQKLKKYPSLKDLPSPDSDLDDYARFASSFDPTSVFQSMWGQDYAGKAMDLWSLSILEFNDNKTSSCSLEELLLCINYNYAAGPYLSSSKNPLDFYNWLVLAMKAKL